MGLLLNEQSGKPYVMDMQPVNLYRGNTKIAGWTSRDYSGASPLTVDGDYNVPPDALTIDGKCVQVEIAHSTNYLKMKDGSVSANGVTCSVSGGVVTLSGTASADTWFEFFPNLKGSTTTDTSTPLPFPATSLFSYNVVSGTISKAFELRIKDDIGGVQPTSATVSGVNSSALTRYTRAWIFIGSGSVCSSYIIKPQVNSGATKLAWDLFQFAAPSPDLAAPISTITGNVGVTGCRKNLLDFTTIAQSWATATSILGGAITCVCQSNSGYPYVKYVVKQLSIGSSYTVKLNFTNASANLIDYEIRRNDGITKVKTGTSTATSGSFVGTFTATDSTMCIFLYPNISGTPNTNTVTFSDIQLELGSTATEYEPYSGNTVTAALGSNVCADLKDGTKDSYDPATGVLTNRVEKVVLNGSEPNWALDSTLDYTATYRKTISGSMDGVGNSAWSRCSHFAWGAGDTVRYSTGYVTIYFKVPKETCPDLTAFKALLAAWAAAGTPLTVYYKLATPTTVQLTAGLPCVRMGIKQISVTCDVVPTINATVKSMD